MQVCKDVLVVITAHLLSAAMQETPPLGPVRDFSKIGFCDQILWRHPAAADTSDIGQGQPVRCGVEGDAAGRAEGQIRQRAGQSFDKIKPASRCGRKNFSAVNPCSDKAIISETVAAPGRSGRPASAQPDTTEDVVPGLTTNRHPAAATCRAC